jgi:hypothetical protein
MQGRLKQVAFGHGGAGFGDHNVIENADLDHTQRVFQLRRDREIRRTGIRVARGMVVKIMWRVFLCA